MVHLNLNWSSQYPVTDLMGGTGTEQLAVQMDEKHTEQRKFITAHFQSIQNFLLLTHMLRQKDSEIVTLIEREFVSTLLFRGLSFSYKQSSACVCACAPVPLAV